MKNQNQTTNQKVFPFKFGKLILILSFVCIALSLAGIVITVLRIVGNGGLHGVLDYFKYPLLILVCIFCILFVISVMLRTEYVVDDKQLVTRYGIVKSTYALKDWASLAMDMDTYKLTINLEDSYFVLALKKEWHAEFIHALLEGNPSLEIDYTFPSENPTDDKKDQ